VASVVDDVVIHDGVGAVNFFFCSIRRIDALRLVEQEKVVVVVLFLLTPLAGYGILGKPPASRPLAGGSIIA